MRDIPITAGGSMNSDKSCLYLDDMPPEFVKGLSVGQEVRVVVTGRVKAVGQRERTIYPENEGEAEKQKTVSHLDLEYSKGSLKLNSESKDVTDLLDDSDAE